MCTVQLAVYGHCMTSFSEHDGETQRVLTVFVELDGGLEGECSLHLTPLAKLVPAKDERSEVEHYDVRLAAGQ